MPSRLLATLVALYITRKINEYNLSLKGISPKEQHWFLRIVNFASASMAGGLVLIRDLHTKQENVRRVYRVYFDP